MIIHYISPYADVSVIEKYMTTPSARAKVEYIKNALKEEGYAVHLFSPIRYKSQKFHFSNYLKLHIDDQENQIYPLSIGGNYSYIKIVSYILVYFQLIWYVLAKVARKDRVILYHSLPDTKIIKFLCLLFKKNVFLEVEEIYNAVYKITSEIDKEKAIISGFVKGYLLVNSIIGEKCKLNKPQVVCEGQYRMIQKKPKQVRNDNGVINLLYAGVIEENSDAFLALSVARLLDTSYFLHIAGYGDKKTIELLNLKIRELNSNPKCCHAIYYGCLHGGDYENLMSLCSIGLCTRMLQDNLSDYTFPSKVFAYLTRNLKVICTPISCVLNSTISESIVFSKDTSAENLVEAIKQATRVNVIDNSVAVASEDARFKKEIIKLLALQ